MDGDLFSLETRESWEFLRAAADLPSHAFQFTNVAASLQLFNGRYIITGIDVNNVGTVAGTLTLYDGQDTSGVQLGVQRVGSTNTVIPPWPARGVLCEIGVFLGVSGGALSGTVWAVPLALYNITPPGR